MAMVLCTYIVCSCVVYVCSYQMTIVLLTFCCYASLHMARRTISVVKVTEHAILLARMSNGPENQIYT